MFIRKQPRSKRTPLFVALTCAAGLVFAAAPAHAGAVSGPITQLEFNAATPAYPQLMLQVNSAAVNYFAQQPTPGCGVPALSADSMKALQGLAQGAFLAGKNVVVYFNVCGGFNYLYDITIVR
jgi:hypothetical protein